MTAALRVGGPAGAGAARTLCGGALADALCDARARLLALVDDLPEVRWNVPFGPGVNPLAWELAHVAWFAEFWTCRGPHRRGADGLVHAARPPLAAGPDELLDSARLPHAARWTAALPAPGAVRAMLEGQLEHTLAALHERAGDDADLLLHRLALFHEDMHAEALVWLRATCGMPAPAATRLPRCPATPAVAVAACEVTLGVGDGEPGFAFDNERRGHRVAVDAFTIDAAPVACGAFAAFVDAGGYTDARLWPGDAGRWRATAGRDLPARWRRADGGFEVRWFDGWRPLDPAEPVVHVNAFEAEAFCRMAGRRLPTAAEWHAAAPHVAWGDSVWEWTADPFAPYAGFCPGPYADYSAPWFHTHRELRGGSFATHARMHDRRYRNFFLPDRADVFTGFRTVARRDRRTGL